MKIRLLHSIALILLLPIVARAQSQQEMNRQAEDQFEKVDARLNAIYQELLSRLDLEGKKKLRASERAWIASRDAAAAAAAEENRGGSIAPFEYATTASDLTTTRLKELQRQLHAARLHKL